MALIADRLILCCLFTRCFAETPNQKNKIIMISEPLDASLAQDIEAGAIKLDVSEAQCSNYFVAFVVLI